MDYSPAGDSLGNATLHYRSHAGDLHAESIERHLMSLDARSSRKLMPVAEECLSLILILS
jgi:hypothetical protein